VSLANDKILENINAKLDDFSSVMKNKLSFNKMLETQLAQIDSAIPSFESSKIHGKPKNIEAVNLVYVKYLTLEIKIFLLRKVISVVP
jgi:hypothetical protein